MLNFNDALLKCMTLLSLMSSVAGFSRGITVGRSMKVEDSDIKESASFAFVPNVLCRDV